MFGRETKAFSCTLYVLAKNILGAKTAKTRKRYKNRGFNENCLKPKMTPSLIEKVFGMGEKEAFTNRVFGKLFSAENTIFIVRSAKHCNCSKNRCMSRKQKMDER